MTETLYASEPKDKKKSCRRIDLVIKSKGKKLPEYGKSIPVKFGYTEPEVIAILAYKLHPVVIGSIFLVYSHSRYIDIFIIQIIKTSPYSNLAFRIIP